TPVMEQLEAAYPDCRLYSLPSVGDNKLARHIELGVKARGAADKKELVSQAFVDLLKILETMQCKFELLD
ncbi:MAG: competence/damage-inducible protein A, partial [Limnobacter sp.]